MSDKFSNRNISINEKFQIVETFNFIQQRTAEPGTIEESLCKLSIGTCLTNSQTGTNRLMKCFKLLPENLVES